MKKHYEIPTHSDLIVMTGKKKKCEKTIRWKKLTQVCHEEETRKFTIFLTTNSKVL